MKQLIIGIFKFLAWMVVILAGTFLIGNLIVAWSMAYNAESTVRHYPTLTTGIPLTQEHVIVQMPAAVLQGDEVLMTLQITNPREEKITFVSFTINREYLSGIDIESSYPLYKDRNNHTSFGQNLFTRFSFDKITIPPLSTLSIEVNTRAISKGKHHGEFTVCFQSSGVPCVRKTIQTIVREP
jgi:hypothetical protein